MFRGEQALRGYVPYKSVGYGLEHGFSPSNKQILLAKTTYHLVVQHLREAVEQKCPVRVLQTRGLLFYGQRLLEKWLSLRILALFNRKGVGVNPFRTVPKFLGKSYLD